MSEELERILSRLTEPDNAVIQQVTLTLDNCLTVILIYITLVSRGRF